MGGSSSGKVNADLGSIRQFAQEMALKVPAEGLPDTMTALAQTAPLVREAFLAGGNPAAGVFQEGVVVADLMTQYLSDFKSFTEDVTKGLRAIGNAAGVIAEIYQNTDGGSAASLADVAFAFADPNATRPTGLPKDLATTTLSEVDAKNGTSSMPMALSGNDNLATVTVYPAHGVTLMMFADGSSEQIVTRPENSSVSSGTSTETVYFAPGGKQLQKTVETSTSVTGGYQVHSVSQDIPGGSTITTTTTNPDGSVTVATTTTPQGGKPTTTTTTVEANQHKAVSDPGPIQQAETQYHTHGDKKTVDKYGLGY